jgi:hypothetical protein
MVGNACSLPLFWGVHFLFGSIATLLVVACYGPYGGAIAASLAGMVPYVLWSDPFPLLLGVGEALVVGLFSRHTRIALFWLDSLFWLSIGAAPVQHEWARQRGPDEYAPRLHPAVAMATAGARGGSTATTTDGVPAPRTLYALSYPCACDTLEPIHDP